MKKKNDIATEKKIKDKAKKRKVKNKSSDDKDMEDSDGTISESSNRIVEDVCRSSHGKL